MRFRKQLIAFLSVLALGGATVGATFAASSSQSTEGDAPETATADPEHAPEGKAYLGVVALPLTEGVRDRFDLPENMEGAVVVKAQRNSPAAEAGLQRGDVILSAGDVDVTNPKDLRDVVQSHDPGDPLVIAYSRDGERDRVRVTLAARPHRNGGGGGHGDRVQNPLKRFLNVFPKAVDGSFRVLDDDGEVHVYAMAQGSITEIGEDSLAIEKATEETASFDIGDDALIVKNGEKVELSDLEVDTRAVVLSVDGEVKAVVVGSPRHRRLGVEGRPRFRSDAGAHIERFEQRSKDLRDRINERFEERLKQFRDRIDERFEEQPVATDPAPPADSTAA